MSSDAISANELRHNLLRWLAMRFPLAHSPAVIARRLGRELGCELKARDVETAAELLCEGDLLRKVEDRVGSDDTYQATRVGRLHWERKSKGGDDES